MVSPYEKEFVTGCFDGSGPTRDAGAMIGLNLFRDAIDSGRSFMLR